MCPEGNEWDAGILTWRPGGTEALSRSGRARREIGLMARLTIAAVTATAAMPRTAARRPFGPAPSASATALAIESFE